MLDLLFPLVDEPEAPAGAFSLVRFSRRAMATTFEVAIPAGTHPNPIAAATAALDLIDDLEDQMTVYRDRSEVVRLNEIAGDGPFEVEQELFDLFNRCAAWTVRANGSFDIATGALIKAWGFFRRDGRVPTPLERNAAMARTGFRHVILDPERRTVRFRRPGLELNLGAVGKGYALDRAARLLFEEWGVRSALLHGGGSSVYALGTPPGTPRGWPIRLKHPTEPGQSLGTLYLRDRGLGTSAATFQFFEYKGERLGHLLDPRTGWPAKGIASANLTAPTAAEADAMSTAAFVLGVAGAERLTRLNPELGAVMLADGANPDREGGGERHSVADAPDSPGAIIFNLTADSFSFPDRTDRP